MPGHEHQIAPNDLRRPPSWAAEIRAEGAREAAKKATREADRAEAEAWSIRMDGYGGQSQPSPMIAFRLSTSVGRDTRYGNCAQMPIMPHTAVLAAGTPD
jgi:hypothetical protein